MRTWHRLGWIVLALAGAPACQWSDEQCRAQGLASVVAPYAHTQPVYDGVHRLDVYRNPAKPTPAPVIVYLHGGGWRGTNWQFSCDTAWALNRVDEGFAIASVEYTEATEVPPTLGGSSANVVRQVREIKHAIRWLKSRARQLGLDPGRFAIAGGSAGGHLAALSGLTEGEALYEPSVPASLAGFDARVAFVFPFAGVYDIGTYSEGWGDALVSAVFGCWAPTTPSWRPCSARTIAEASPIHHIDASDPPVFVSHGVQDGVVPPSQADAFTAALCAAGKLAGYHRAPDIAHNFEPAFSTNTWLGVLFTLGIDGQIQPPAGCP